MKLSMGIMGIAVVAATLVSPVANAAWDGDILYAAQNRWSGDPDRETWRYGIALAYCNFGTNFYGGQISCARQMSEPLVQNGHNGNDVVYLSRAIVMYDSTTALMLGSATWNSSSPRVYVSQLEYVDGAWYEDQGLTNPGTMTTQGGTQPITDGGCMSGRLRLAVDEVGYDPGEDDGGIDPRLLLDGTIGAGGLKGADNVMDMAVDDNGHLYIAGRVDGTGSARIYKVPKLDASRILSDSDGQRVHNQFGAPALLVQKVTSVSWFTGVAVGGGGVYATDYTVQSVDVYDSTTGAPKLSVNLSTPNGLIPGVPALMPEDVVVDPSYAGGGVRLIVQVLDQVGTSPLRRVDLLVLDVDPVTGTLLAAKALCINGGIENGHLNYTAIDWLAISPDGDLMSVDSGGSNGDRAHSITSEVYAAAMAVPALIVPIVNATNNMWMDRFYDHARGAAFMIPPSGDLDGDGDVDLDDFIIFAPAMNGPGAPPGDPAGDVDGDGDCDLKDWSVLAQQYGL